MTFPMIGILIVGCVAFVIGLLCMISSFLRRRKDETYVEFKDGYWNDLETYLSDNDPEKYYEELSIYFNDKCIEQDQIT